MPRTGITAYDLLISCPGGVAKYVNVVKESIDKFNRLLGRINNAEIVDRHWSTDSYSQSGDKPQELLNFCSNGPKELLSYLGSKGSDFPFEGRLYG